MGKKVAAPAKSVAASDPGADDLQIMHPDLTTTIAGQKITVREYGFVEGLRLRSLAQPLLDALHAKVAVGRFPELEEIIAILGDNAEAVAQLIAAAADVEVEWLHGLNQREGHQLMLLWWTANGPFYVKNVFDRIMAEAAAAKVRAGQTSTPSSSPVDTATPTASAG